MSVSLDGPPEIHDKYRIDFKGNGTHAETRRGIEALRKAGHDPAIIVVCNPDDRSRKGPVLCRRRARRNAFRHPAAGCQPQATIRLRSTTISSGCSMSGTNNIRQRGVRISTLDAMIQGLLGEISLSDTIGLGPIDTVTLMTDGGLEPLDVLRIAGEGFTQHRCPRSGAHVAGRAGDARWRDAFEASTTLCDTCRALRISRCLRRRPSGAALVAGAETTTIQASIAKAGSAFSGTSGTVCRRRCRCIPDRTTGPGRDLDAAAPAVRA